jgi:phage tail protein X
VLQRPVPAEDSESDRGSNSRLNLKPFPVSRLSPDIQRLDSPDISPAAMYEIERDPGVMGTGTPSPNAMDIDLPDVPSTSDLSPYTLYATLPAGTYDFTELPESSSLARHGSRHTP